ncbi:MAG: 50S ribosomal protein L10 [Clostridiales bacterium]|nr:50S ribosomal protein L10 [Clostridiales bacterium]HBM79908.1 50S ribosomal protein L10 [Clostridiaceae bacterium]
MAVKEEKKAVVQNIKEKFDKAQTVVFADYRGLTVQEDTELRRKFREAGVEYKVLKNTLTSIAAKEAGAPDINKFLSGPTSFAFGYDDLIEPARVLRNFIKEHKKMEIKGAIVKGKIYDADKVNELAAIPPREVLIAKLLGSFKAPLSKFAYLVNAIKEQKEAQNNE